MAILTQAEIDQFTAIIAANDYLVRLLGGQPLFLDPLEADGMIATAHTLPQVLSTAMLNATVGQPGWQETRRFAGRPYARVAGILGDDTLESLKQSLLLNPEKTVHSLDLVIGALTHLRDAVKEGNGPDLEKRLRLAFDDQTAWLKERSRAEWDKEEKKPVEMDNPLRRLFTGSRPKKS